MSTLANWEDSCTILLCQKLPLQTYESAQALVLSYLTSVGGWVPTDNTMPTGEGLPANRQNEDQASTSIMQLQYGKIYSCDLTIQATLGLNLNVNLATVGLDNASVIESLVSTLNSWVTDQLAGTKITLETINSTLATVTNRGILVTADQVALNNIVTGENKILDPRAIALNLGRTIYTLDNTWNVSHVYTQTNDNITCIIEKYQSTSYLALDTSASNYYVISIDPTTYSLVTGTKLSH